MRQLCSIALLSLPLLLAGPVVAGQTQGNPLLGASPAAPPPVQSTAAAPIAPWVRLVVEPPATASEAPDLSGFGFARPRGSGFEYILNPRWAAHASVRKQSWIGAGTGGGCLAADPAVREAHCGAQRVVPQLVDGEIGATFRGQGYSLGLGLSATHPAAAVRPLPRILPDASFRATLNGLPFASLAGSTSLHARGRVALGTDTGIDLGASVGRIRLLPGNLLGIDTFGQKSLSLGMDSGRISGHIVGRIIQPRSGAATSLLGPDHRWTSVDLGVTWQLPWKGSLSFGAQNVWSSGHTPQPKKGPPTPQPSSIPYVQYHQDF